MKKLITFLLGLSVLCFSVNGSPVFTRVEALPARAWEASEWISAADMPVVTGTVRSAENCRAADGASWFVLRQANSAQVVRARWMTTALGVYELYVNGKPVGREFLKPGFTHVAKTRNSFTYDITDAFQKQKGWGNVLAAEVTPGWWADKVVTPSGHEGMIGRKPAFRSVLELTYADGSTEYIGTDTLRWTAGVAGPVTHAAIYDGEEYDARLRPGYESPLGTPEINREFSGEIIPAAGAEVYLREDISLKPVLAYVWEKVEGQDSLAYGKVVVKRRYPKGRDIKLNAGETLIVDFGQNASAVPFFVFKAQEGVTLTCLPAELLNDGNGAKSRGMDGPEGSVHRTNLRTPDEGMRLVYTFGPGGKWATYHPHFTFFGYRFISVTATGPVRIRSVESIPVTSITKPMETGKMETGFKPINQLISNTVWGQLSNYLSVPTDCPQRNERAGWTADTQVFTQTGAFFANTDAFFRKWMRDMRDTQGPNGAFMAVAPPAGFGSNPMRFGWSDAGIIVPWTVWKQFADKEIVEENWEAMVRYMNHVAETRYDHRFIGPETGNQQYADWLSYEPLETSGRAAFIPGSKPRTPLPEAEEYWSYLGACYWALDAGMMRDMAAAIGRETAPWESMAAEAKSYLKERFLTPEGLFKVDVLNTMQTPALFALKTGLVEGEARQAMLKRLRENFAAHGNCLQTGFLGTSILLQTLTENGMADVAWELVFQRKCPSWLYSVDNGATTIWERWNSYTLEEGMGPKGMNSFNHYAYGCVCQWLWETAAGIASDASAPGFKHILMRPVPDKRLGSMEATYNSVAGLIKSEWHYEGDTWVWTFTMPEGSTASVTLPGSCETKSYSAGTFEIRL
ncbi:MAG: family 78 glycoside hydrolase catalytic domain [Bacteroidales bacterium]|nr:family 78 glycoside hydrolase catalytic domain [Bacteroidales bacterium]